MMMKQIRFCKGRSICLIIVTLLAGSNALAQELPATRIWLARIIDDLPVEPVPVSSSDRYNNQPMFSPDGQFVYFTAEQADGQTDIARYDISNGQLRAVNESSESEYSPTPIPGQDALSVIRVELPDLRQRLWRIPLDGAPASLLMPNVEPVGYHSWIDSESIALFILGDSFTLHKASIGDQPSVFLADHIGRTLRRHPGTGQILFVDKKTEPWSIASIDAQSGDQQTVMPLLPGIEDFEVDSKGRYWMGYGSKLYHSNAANSRWELSADLRGYGIDNITRLASSPDGNFLAIVGSR